MTVVEPRSPLNNSLRVSKTTSHLGAEGKTRKESLNFKSLRGGKFPSTYPAPKKSTLKSQSACFRLGGSMGRESAGEPVQIATETADLTSELKRGLSFVRKHTPARKKKRAA